MDSMFKKMYTLEDYRGAVESILEKKHNCKTPLEDNCGAISQCGMNCSTPKKTTMMLCIQCWMNYFVH